MAHQSSEEARSADLHSSWELLAAIAYRWTDRRDPAIDKAWWRGRVKFMARRMVEARTDTRKASILSTESSMPSGMPHAPRKHTEPRPGA